MCVLPQNLGICYKCGHGVAKDYLEARQLYSLASAQGHAQATDKLNLLDEKIRTECPLLGKRVVITGTSRGNLNGRAGNATSFDHERARYVVELDNDTDGRDSEDGEAEAKARERGGPCGEKREL